MTVQIINLDDIEIFKKFNGTYKILQEDYRPGLLGLEIRNIADNFTGNVLRNALPENWICCKSVKENGREISFLICGSIKNMEELPGKILAAGDGDLGYSITNAVKNYERYGSNSYNIGNKEFSFDKSYTMGILNVTPDSFSDGGKFFSADNAVSRGLEMLKEGADIIDIGGESSRPGSEPVNAGEEIKRIIPVLERILRQMPDAVISIDTTKKEVAEAALSAGAKIINDISALSFEPDILGVIQKYGASIILMHMKGTPKNMQANPVYNDVIGEIYDFFTERIQAVSKAGIKNIFIDPGIGFGKTLEHNLEILKRLGDFKSLGYPVLIGVSRKSFIGKILDLNVEERDAATAVIESMAVKNGARIIRTHNVKYGIQVCKLLNKLM